MAGIKELIIRLIGLIIGVCQNWFTRPSRADIIVLAFIFLNVCIVLNGLTLECLVLCFTLFRSRI